LQRIEKLEEIEKSKSERKLEEAIAEDWEGGFRQD
jgi:hypothetical protein